MTDHQRRPDQAITDPDEQLAIIRGCKPLTMALGLRTEVVDEEA